MIRRAVMTTRRRPYAELVREAEKARLLLDAARQLGESLEPERVYERFRELLGDVVEHEPGVYYDVDRDGRMRKIPDTGPPKTRAALMVPVKHEGAVVGVVQVMSDRAEYDAEQLELVEGLVGQMAAAVRNARLQKQRSRLEAAEAAALAVAAEREQAAYVLEAGGDGIFLLDDARLV